MIYDKTLDRVKPDLCTMSSEPVAFWREDGLLVTGEDAAENPWSRLREVMPNATREDYRKMDFKVDGTKLEDPKELERYSLEASTKGEKCFASRSRIRVWWSMRTRTVVRLGARLKRSSAK